MPTRRGGSNPPSRTSVKRDEVVKTKVVEKGEWGREIEVEVPADRIEKELDRAYRHYQKRVEVPGFRKGKAPLSIIKVRYGESIRGNVINDLLPTLLEEASRETGLVPVGPPSIAKLTYEPGRELNFTATLEIWPEIEIADWENLKVTAIVHQVTDEEIDAQMDEIRNRQATEQSVQRELERGDVLIADLQRLDDGGLPIIGEKFEERYFIIGGGNSNIPEFEEALIGVSVGEERKVRFAHRDGPRGEEMVGREEFFSVRVREIRERTLPELDDDFARDVGEHFRNLEDLREHLSTQLAQRWEVMGRHHLRNSLIDELIKANPFDLPESMVKNYLHNIHKERAHGHDQGHQNDSEHDHDHSEEEWTTAVRRLKSYLIIEAVRKKAAIEVSDEELDQYLQKRAVEMGVKMEDVRRSDGVESLRRELVENKVFDFLIECADVEEKSV